MPDEICQTQVKILYCPSVVKKFIFKVLRCLQIHPLMRFLLRNKTIILSYHGVTDQEKPDGLENYDGKHLSIEKFEMQLKYLKKHYSVIPLRDYLQRRLQGLEVPLYSVILTFDDGYESNYSLAFPLLKKYALPATIFLTTNFLQKGESLWTDRIEYALDHAEPKRYDFTIENETIPLALETAGNGSKISCVNKIKCRLKNTTQEFVSRYVGTLEDLLGHRLSQEKNPPFLYRPLQRHQVLEMTRSGLVSLGSHTHTHRILSRCQPETARQELLQSKQWIESETLSPCEFFCYPNGEEGDFNLLTKQLLKEAGYQCAFTAVEGFNDCKTDLFELKRIGVGNRGDEVEFSMTLCGIKRWFSDLKRIIRHDFKSRILEKT